MNSAGVRRIFLTTANKLMLFMNTRGEADKMENFINQELPEFKAEVTITPVPKVVMSTRHKSMNETDVKKAVQADLGPCDCALTKLMRTTEQGKEFVVDVPDIQVDRLLQKRVLVCQMVTCRVRLFRQTERCRTCLEYGHGSCKSAVACFRCGGPHMARDCREAPRFGACFRKYNKDERHDMRSKECPAFKEYMSKRFRILTQRQHSHEQEEAEDSEKMVVNQEETEEIPQPVRDLHP